MDSWIKALTLVTAGLGLAACATSKHAVFPQGGPDMATVYERHQHDNGTPTTGVLRQRLQRQVEDGPADLHGYTRQAADEIDQVFPLLPNPQLVLFVFPHLSAEGAPVPGYSTAFPMYETDHYAMPGEVYQP